MKKEIKNNFYYVGAQDKDRRMFDKLIFLPDGTSYNSYLINGSEKTALIDTVDPTKTNVLLKNLDELGIDNIDYIIANHAEQDHSGSIPVLIEKFPRALVLCSDKCKQMIIDLLNIPENRIKVVKDRENISLGDKTLEFLYTPWVHWPETMSTYLKEDKILFSCDFFGSHYSTEDILFFDEKIINQAARLYYAEIMMPFRNVIKNNLEIIKNLKIDMIAPSHGPVYQQPDFIIQRYNEWVNNEPKNKILIAYISMHESTEIIAKYLLDSLSKNSNIEVKLFDLSVANDFIYELVDAKTILFGSPTFLTKMHPFAKLSVNLVTALKPKIKYLGLFGSYGWGSMIIKEFQDETKSMNIEMFSPVLIKGIPKDKDYLELDKFIKEIEEKHKKG